jgi:uncharacterized membrane protein YbhN (UPF0104 family)
MTLRLEAHAVALGLVLLDLAARTVRIRGLMALVHLPLRWRDAVCLNAWSDLAASLTPMRLGGEPARYMALRIFRVPFRPALGGLALEMAIATPVTILLGATLVLLFGDEWLATQEGPVRRSLIWVVAGVLLVAGATAAVLRRRRGPPRLAEVARPPATLLAVLLAAATTVVSVMSRVAILPVLMIAAGMRGEVDVTLLGSFVLLFGQLLLPVPAGIGVVDAAFLGGVAGVTATTVLVTWRFYTTGFGVILGAGLLLWRGVPLGAFLRSGRLGVSLPGSRRFDILVEEAIEDRPPAPPERGGSCGTPQTGTQPGVGQ